MTSSESVTIVTASPCHNLAGAYAELKRLSVNGKLPYGDGAKVKVDYHLNDKDYATLRQRLRRERVTINATPTPRLPAEQKKADLHGYSHWETTVPETWIPLLPRKGTEKHGYWGFSNDHVAMNAYKNGKVLVYLGKSLFAKQELVRLLTSFGWTGEMLSPFLQSLKKNGETQHIAIPDPNAKPMPEKTLVDNGLYKLTYHADKTPYPDGTAEYEFSDSGLKELIENLEFKMDKLQQVILKNSGGASIASLIISLDARIDALQHEVLELRKGSPPSSPQPAQFSPQSQIRVPVSMSATDRSNGVSADGDGTGELSLEKKLRKENDAEIREDCFVPKPTSRCDRVRGDITDGYFCGIDGETVWEKGSARIQPFCCLTNCSICRKLGGL